MKHNKARWGAIKISARNPFKEQQKQSQLCKLSLSDTDKVGEGAKHSL